MNYATGSAPSPFFISTETSRWWTKRGTQVSIVLHVLALLAIWRLSAAAAPAPRVPPPVELIRLKPAPPQLVPPKPQPVKQKPVSVAPPKAVVRPQPVPKTVAAPAAKAETYTPPVPPVAAAPIGPVTPAAPAPAAPSTPAPAATVPKVVATEGIPTDYVNQVYSRINRNADYPREAKLRRQQGRVGYKLTLDPQGALISFDIQSSGSDSLDEAARDAIKRAAPFPKLPDLGGSTYLLAGSIVFKIN